jgi:hypothetical protein
MVTGGPREYYLYVYITSPQDGFIQNYDLIMRGNMKIIEIRDVRVNF